MSLLMILFVNIAVGRRVKMSRMDTLLEWNNTFTETPKNQCIHEIFEDFANANPKKIAVIFNQSAITYEELNAKSNQLARHLSSKGVHPDKLIGVCVNRSIHFIIAILAVLKSGCGYIPLEGSYPKKRLQLMAEDAELDVIITDAYHNSIFEDDRLHTIMLEDKINFDSFPSTNIPRSESGVSTNNLAYMIYTSGSTGKPKGVMIEHRNVIRLLSNTHEFNFEHDFVVAQTTKSSFDPSIFEIWSALCNGLTLDIIEDEIVINPQALEAHIIHHNIDVIHITTGLLNQIANVHPNIFSSIKYLFFGGEAASKKALTKLINSNPKTQLINCYGPTENTVFSTTCFINKNSLKNNVSIGKVVSNSSCVVLDIAGENLVPVGQLGELYVGGDGLSRGYFKQDKLTASRFIENKIAPSLGKKLYKTGDLVIRNSDGSLEYHGRIDDQIKVRGHRVELGEIEQILLSESSIAEACVAYNKDNDKIYAFIVGDIAPNAVGSFTEISEIIHEILRSHIPNYMLPHKTFKVIELPLTPNGKTDKKALLNLVQDNRNSSFSVENLSKKEAFILKTINSVVDLKLAEIDDNLFECGLDSLNFITIRMHIQLAGYKIDYASFLKEPSFRALCKYTCEALQEQTASNNGRKELFLPPNQLMSFQTKDNNRNLFTIPFIKYYKNVDIEHLRESITVLVNRHDALRVRSRKENGVWVQNISSKVNFGFEMCELENIRNDDARKFIVEKCKHHNTSLNIEKGKLLSVCAFKTKDHDISPVFFSFHHTASDRVSVENFLFELDILLESIDFMEPGYSLPQVKSYEEYCLHWENYSNSANFISSLKTIKQSLEWHNDCSTPADSNAQHLSADSKEALLTIPPSESIIKLSTIEQIALVLHAASSAFSETYQQKSFGYRVFSHGRDIFLPEVDFSQTFGWLVSEIPVFIQEKDIKCSDHLNKISDIFRKSKVISPAYNLGKFSSSPNIRHMLDDIPLPDILINYIPAQEDRLDFVPEAKILQELSDTSEESVKNYKHYIEIRYCKNQGIKNVRWQYCNKQYNKESIQKIHDIFVSKISEYTQSRATS